MFKTFSLTLSNYHNAFADADMDPHCEDGYGTLQPLSRSFAYVDVFVLPIFIPLCKPI